MNSDRFTKQIIIGTLCAIAVAFSFTICTLAFKQLQIPVEVKDLATYIIGVLSGMLAKTGLDALAGTQAAPVIVDTAPGKPIETTPAEAQTREEPEPTEPK